MNKEEVYNFLINLTKNMSREDLNNISKRFRGKSDVKDFLIEMVNNLDIRLNEVIYLILHKMDKPQECPDCGNRCRFQTFLKGYTKYCGKCGLKHSAETTRLIMENKSEDEKRDIIRRTQESLKLSREQKKQEVIDISNLNRSDIKNYILQYIGSDPERIRGIGNHLLHKRPDIYQYLKNEQDKFGYDNNSAIIYMILNDMIEPPKCISCNTNYCSFHFDINSNEKKFSNYCSICGLKYGGVNANKSFASTHDNKTVFEIKEYRDKGKQTLLDKTGFEFASQNPETIRKIRESSNRNNGGMGFGSNKVLEKINETMMKNHDCTIWEFSGTEDCKDKVKRTSLDKFGVTNWMKSDHGKQYFHDLFVTPEVIERAKKLLYDKFELELVSEYYNAKTPIKVRHKCGNEFWISCYNQVQGGLLMPYCKECYTAICRSVSGPELRITKELSKLYPDLLIKTSVRTILEERKELDIYIPDKNIAIEYDGLWCHSSNEPTSNHEVIDPKPINYHYNKYKQCLDKGIHLLTAFEVVGEQFVIDKAISIIKDNRYININELEKYEVDNVSYYLIDNRYDSYEFFRNKNDFKLIGSLDPKPWFWESKDHDFMRIDKFIESYCSNNEDPFEFAKQYKYNWIYDCGYQIIKSKH